MKKATYETTEMVLYHLTPNAQELITKGFTKEKLNPRLPQISTLPSSAVDDYLKMGDLKNRQIVGIRTKSRILDASDTVLTPLNILNGYGENAEFDEILEKAANSVGVTEKPYLANISTDKRNKFWTTMNNELIKYGYGGYRAGEEITLVDLDQIIDVFLVNKKDLNKEYYEVGVWIKCENCGKTNTRI